MNSPEIRSDWTLPEVLALYEMPLEALRAKAKSVHAKYGAPDVQKCALLSIKTGACSEDCGYCSQSARFKTGLEAEPLWDVDVVLEKAAQAKAEGASRFCLGAAWRSLPEGPRFGKLEQMVEGIAQMQMEVCCTFGMATEDQLRRLKKAGLTAYNHNLDTSREYYPNIVTTHTYDDRLETVRAAQRAGVQVCSGGILGLGESIKDRAELLLELAKMTPHPESVPINLLVPIEGTPLEKNPPVPFEDFLRTIAIARILMPRARVRLSAGRNLLSREEQIECFEVGANSIFHGEKLLTAPNVDPQNDVGTEWTTEDRLKFETARASLG